MQKSLKDENLIITGSYDEKLRTIDIRNMKELVNETRMNGSIWDFKQEMFKGEHLLFLTCVYDGFKIFDYGKLKILREINDLHDSIVYGVDTKRINDDILVTSCSFYDNLTNLWIFN
jgi:diphthamide biosynthesis protein 7